MAITKNIKTDKSVQEIANLGFDSEFNLPVVGLLVYNPTTSAMDRMTQPNLAYAQKVTVVDTTTYIGIAVPGTLQSDAKWQAEKIVVSGGTTTITWADGGAFTQVATDLTALVYS